MAADVALNIRGLTFRYTGSATDGDAAPWTIDIPSLELARGEQMLLTGGSGRGKSTLLQLIAGLLDPASGEVLVAGQNIHQLRGAKRDLYRGRSIGMIFQTFNLLQGFSAIENVMIALMFSDVPSREHRDRAAKLLTRLGITEPDRKPEAMSVGQQQRIAVARSLACGPALVLADEPTASLDPENAETAMELIQNACRDSGAALLCVSHDPAMAERFSRRTSLDALSNAKPANAKRSKAGEGAR